VADQIFLDRLQRAVLGAPRTSARTSSSVIGVSWTLCRPTDAAPAPWRWEDALVLPCVFCARSAWGRSLGISVSGGSNETGLSYPVHHNSKLKVKIKFKAKQARVDIKVNAGAFVRLFLALNLALALRGWGEDQVLLPIAALLAGVGLVLARRLEPVLLARYGDIYSGIALKQVDALYERALLSFAEHRLPAAIADLSAALKLKPDYAEALLARATAYHAIKDDVKARADLDTLGKLQIK
jgi:tetratricopeptide (TPR) repeat protein